MWGMNQLKITSTRSRGVIHNGVNIDYGEPWKPTPPFRPKEFPPGGPFYYPLDLKRIKGEDLPRSFRLLKHLGDLGGSRMDFELLHAYPDITTAYTALSYCW
jgi:hypothetical protein